MRTRSAQVLGAIAGAVVGGVVVDRWGKGRTQSTTTVRHPVPETGQPPRPSSDHTSHGAERGSGTEPASRVAEGSTGPPLAEPDPGGWQSLLAGFWLVGLLALGLLTAGVVAAVLGVDPSADIGEGLAALRSRAAADAAAAEAGIQTLGVMVALVGVVFVAIGRAEGALPTWMADRLSAAALALGGAAVALATALVVFGKPSGLLSVQLVGLALIAALLAAATPGRKRTADETARGEADARRRVAIFDARRALLEAEGASDGSAARRARWMVTSWLVGGVPAVAIFLVYAVVALVLGQSVATLLTPVVAGILVGGFATLAGHAQFVAWATIVRREADAVDLSTLGDEARLGDGDGIESTRPHVTRLMRVWRAASWPSIGASVIAVVAIGVAGADMGLALVAGSVGAVVGAPALVWDWIWPQVPRPATAGRRGFAAVVLHGMRGPREAAWRRAHVEDASTR